MFWNIKHPIFAYMEGHLSLGILPYTMVGKYPYTQTLLFGILYTISPSPLIPSIYKLLEALMG